jgi:hypothetical protein
MSCGHDDFLECLPSALAVLQHRWPSSSCASPTRSAAPSEALVSGDRRQIKQAAEKGRHRSRIPDSAVDNHSLPVCCAASRFSRAGATKGEPLDSESEMVRNRAFQLRARTAKAAISNWPLDCDWMWSAASRRAGDRALEFVQPTQ